MDKDWRTPMTLSPASGNSVWKAFSVSEINTVISDVLTANLPKMISVEGEISNLSVANSGHRYFSLQDSQSTISCALFRNAAHRISRDVLNTLKNGDKVVVKANVNVYQPRGSYQLIVNDVEPAGFGALAKAFAELKQKLDAAGYTASKRKRPIPTWATNIAVVTSATGAAVHDVLTTLERRAPFIPVTVYPTAVQGNTAPPQIIQALADANICQRASVILLVRGGGSLEDLQAFNDESVAMAVVNSRLPVVSGVGHETDFTIVDFVSDARAPTPTAAAEWVSPDKNALLQSLKKQSYRLHRVTDGFLLQRRTRLQSMAKRLSVQHPQRLVQQQGQRLDEIAARIEQALMQQLHGQQRQLAQLKRQLWGSSPQQNLNRSNMQLLMYQQTLQQLLGQRVEQEKQIVAQFKQRVAACTNNLWRYQQQLKGLQARLMLLSPLGVLSRGYAVVFDDSTRAVRHANDVRVGDTLRIRLASGELIVEVQSQKMKA